jgi:hypothetical protein
MSFVANLSDFEGEAAETQVRLDFSFASKYINEHTYNEIYQKYAKFSINLSICPFTRKNGYIEPHSVSKSHRH